MRLLNVRTFEQADQFQNNRKPPYAILSHRWGENELSYQDFLNTSKTALRTGSSKIAHACAQARQAGLDWIWIDTCCIDRTSSTELSRSINSMFKWYQDAQVCFAYLEGVDSQKKVITKVEVEDQILKSEWFRRGWTLQEMLASSEMEFFDANWAPLGSRSQLAPVISRATRISLGHLKDFRSASVAQKMSWMADRVTAEEEDTAYCMLGIFDLNMDLRYGEGKKAFPRLQEMIISSIPDESVFAWTSNTMESCGLLAPWPDCFRDSGDIVLQPKKCPEPRGPYQMTSQGLMFPAPITYVVKRNERKDIKLSLKCWMMRQQKWRAVVLFLSNAEGYWKRVRCSELGGARKVKLYTKGRFMRGIPWTQNIYIPQKNIVK